MLRKVHGQVPAVDLPESPQKFSQNPPREAACIHPLHPSAGSPRGTLSAVPAASPRQPRTLFTFLCDLREVSPIQAARPSPLLGNPAALLSLCFIPFGCSCVYVSSHLGRLPSRKGRSPELTLPSVTQDLRRSHTCRVQLSIF